MLISKAIDLLLVIIFTQYCSLLLAVNLLYEEDQDNKGQEARCSATSTLEGYI